MTKTSRYSELIEKVFFAHYEEGMGEFEFARSELEDAARALGIELPKNLGDLVYSFRYRVPLPESVREKAPEGRQWIVEPAGRGRYRFKATSAPPEFIPNASLVETKVPDATPGIISMYALSDEQALLAKLRYNRLIDTFTRVTCYPLQSHLRTFVEGVGQVETDEVYVGVDRRGVHYVFPVQAKGGRDRLSVVQVRQDLEMCQRKFPGLVARPIGAQFMQGDLIALFEFQPDDGIRIAAERHYRLVPPEELSPEDLAGYRVREETDD